MLDLSSGKIMMKLCFFLLSTFFAAATACLHLYHLCLVLCSKVLDCENVLKSF